MRNIFLLPLAILAGCPTRDFCVNGAQRVGDQCILVRDGSSRDQTSDVPPDRILTDGPADGPVVEICNDIDDDGDGYINEGVVVPMMPAVRINVGALLTINELAAAATPDGYVVVWYDGSDGQPRYLLVGTDGVPMGSPVTVAPTPAEEPAVAVVESRFVVAWIGGVRVYARSFPLDGGAPSDVVQMNVDPPAKGPSEAVGFTNCTHVSVISFGRSSVIAWRCLEGIAATLASPDLTALSELRTVYRFVGSSTRNQAPILIPVHPDSPYLLAALVDTRIGDLEQRVYFGEYSPLLTTSDTWTGVADPTVNAGLAQQAVDSPSDDVSIVTLPVSDLPIPARQVASVRVQIAGIGRPIGVGSTTVLARERFFFVGAAFAFGGVVETAWIELVGADVEIIRRTSTTTGDVFAEDRFPILRPLDGEAELAIVRGSASTGAIFYAEQDSVGGPSQLLMQRLGCPP